MLLQTLTLPDYPQGIVYRPDSLTDRAVITEVIEKRCYRRKSINFDVQEGEVWLDLGGNIGAFAVYCQMHGAKAVSYEPDYECFQILKRNNTWRCVNTAITIHRRPSLRFWRQPNPQHHSRGTTLHNPGSQYKPADPVSNTYVGKLKEEFSTVDGIKMDIEGAEHAILDSPHLLPRTNKLVMEYHTTMDQSMENMMRRIKTLRRMFRLVVYSAEFDRAVGKGLTHYKGCYNKNIFCIGRRR